jgi:multicomponent Na+:H+ antiporter subunit G
VPVLAAVVVGQGIDSTYASRALIMAFLLLLLNPVASHALARAADRSGVPMWQGAVLDEGLPGEKNEEPGS